MPMTKLHLLKNKLTDLQVEPLAAGLKKSRDLRSVYMSHNFMSNEALGILSDALALNVGIEELSLTHNDLSLPNGVKLIRALKNMPNLKKISLNSCNMDMDLLQELSDSLSQQDVLTDLNLYSNEINSEGAKIIAGMLKNKVNLKALGLSNNYIGHGGARELASTC